MRLDPPPPGHRLRGLPVWTALTLRVRSTWHGDGKSAEKNVAQQVGTKQQVGDEARAPPQEAFTDHWRCTPAARDRAVWAIATMSPISQLHRPPPGRSRAAPATRAEPRQSGDQVQEQTLLLAVEGQQSKEAT
jgi:hypothetical protein